MSTKSNAQLLCFKKYETTFFPLSAHQRRPLQDVGGGGLRARYRDDPDPPDGIQEGGRLLLGLKVEALQDGQEEGDIRRDQEAEPGAGEMSGLFLSIGCNSLESAISCERLFWPKMCFLFRAKFCNEYFSFAFCSRRSPRFPPTSNTLPTWASTSSSRRRRTWRSRRNSSSSSRRRLPPRPPRPPQSRPRTTTPYSRTCQAGPPPQR